MPRSPHAAKTLRDQLIAKLGRVADSKAGLSTMTPVGEPDGLGTYRSFEFDPISSKVLVQLLPALEDKRIESFSDKTTGTGKNAKTVVTVNFAAGTVADSRSPFPLGAADDVEDEESDEEPPQA